MKKKYSKTNVGNAFRTNSPQVGALNANTLATNDGTIVSLKFILGILALFASAQLSIPLKPVPITFQTVMISLIGLTYSPKLGALTVSAYLVAGILGLPMFSKLSGGLNYFLGTTCGYLIGCLIAAPVIGIVKNKLPQGVLSVACSCFIGHIIIYTLGVAWLSTFIGLSQAIYSGFIIYIPTGLLKIIIFSYLFSYVKNKKPII